MSRILLASEFGGAYGHVARLLPLGQELARRGHDVVFALRDLLVGEIIVGSRGLPVLQAPTDTGPRPGGWGATYPALLHVRGYHRRECVLGMLKAWLSLFDLIRPALVIGDFSPTATLAARLRDTPAGAFGCGYYCPPRRIPMPVIPALAERAGDATDIERMVLDNLNHAATRCGGTAFAAFADFLPPIADVLCTFPELDPYGPRMDTVYWGALDQPFGTATPVWPDAPGPRLLAYVAASYPALPKLLADLGRLGLPTLLHLRGPGGHALAAPSNMRITEEAFDLGAALEETALVVCNSSHGLCTKALAAGVPLVLLPAQTEQASLADRVVRLGAGVQAPLRGDPAFDYAGLIEAALGNPALAAGAMAFSERYAGFDPEAAIARIVSFYEKVLAG